MTDIRKARMDAKFTLGQVAAVFGNSREWLRRVEVGTLSSSPDVRRQIIEAIRRLSDLRDGFQRCIRESFPRLKAGLHIRL